MSHYILEAKNICKKDKNSNKWIFNDINISIKAGDKIAITGPTGSGKTVLLRSLALLDPIDAGEVLWKGKKIENKKIPTFRKNISYLHQQPVIFEGSVESNLLIPFNLTVNKGLHFDRKKIVEMLEEIGLEQSFLEKNATDLSGGERQVVSILRSIQTEPTVLLLDEPTSALDEKTTRSVEMLINKWFSLSSSTRAFIWVSHSIQQIKRVAKTIYTMKERKLFKGV